MQHCQLHADNLLWNIWVLLSLPAVWLAWPAIDFFIVIALLLWKVAPGGGGINESPPGTSQDADILGPRIVVTATWAIGVFHIFMVAKSFLAWSGAGNIIEFDQRKLEEGEDERVPESIRDEIPLMREDDELGTQMDNFPPQTTQKDRL